MVKWTKEKAAAKAGGADGVRALPTDGRACRPATAEKAKKAKKGAK